MAQAMPSTSRDGGGDTEQQPTVELIHGVSDLPDGYGEIFYAAAVLPQCCLNAVYKIVYIIYISYLLIYHTSNVAKMLIRCCILSAVQLLICYIVLYNIA